MLGAQVEDKTTLMKIAFFGAPYCQIWKKFRIDLTITVSCEGGIRYRSVDSEDSENMDVRGNK